MTREDSEPLDASVLAAAPPYISLLVADVTARRHRRAEQERASGGRQLAPPVAWRFVIPWHWDHISPRRVRAAAFSASMEGSGDGTDGRMGIDDGDGDGDG